MKKRLIVLVLLLQPFAVAQNLAEVSEYQAQIDEINQRLKEIDDMKSSFLCPGTTLALNCGNDRCEPNKGEDDTNCPADCIDSPVKSYDHAMVCRHVQQFFTPSSSSELQAIVQYAVNAGAHVRVVGSRHSVNDQYCSDGIVISTARLNKIIGIVKEDDGSESVWTEPGVILGDLAEWLHVKNRTLGYAQLGFRLASVGGAIGTGAHGSSPRHTAVISNLVRAVTLVDGEGNIREVSGDNDAMRAVRAHLGLLGAVVRVKLKVIPQFRLQVQVSDGDDESLLRDGGIFRQIGKCDFALINWFPNTHRFVKSCGMETTKSAETAAENVLLMPKIPLGLTQPFKVALHYAQCYEPLAAALEGLRYLQLKWSPPFQKDYLFGVVEPVYDAVGYSHRMVSSRLIDTEQKFFTNDWELAVPFSKAQRAIRAVSEYAHDAGLYVPLVGVFLRFAPSDDASLLAHTTSVGLFKKREPVVFIEFPTPAPVGFPPGMADDINRIYEDLARLLIEQFDARPHWGKNKNFAFKLADDLGVYKENKARFQAVQYAFDPNGLFLTEFSENAGLN